MVEAIDRNIENCRLLIVDAHAYAYRAFFAIRALNSPTGAPTNAIYGFIKMLTKMRATLAPTHLAVVWDGGLAEARMTLLPEYKAQRPSMPGDLESQLDQINEYLAAANIHHFTGDGIEADDWIATLARRAEREGCSVVIASSDKDFMQLVSPRVGLLNPNDKSEAIWTDAQVLAKTGVEPAKIVDWLSLIGDSVDNIPGVPGVGPKTATDLLHQFGSIGALYEQVDQVRSERLRANLRAAEALVRRNQQLIRLIDDLPCETRLEEFIIQPPDLHKLELLYERWGFKTMLQELRAARQAQGELL